MPSLLERKLIVVTGKGGVGKSTIAAALALLGARAGKRTAVACMDGREHSGELLADAGVSRVVLDPERDLLAWTRRLGGRVSGRLLASSATFQYFAAAAPGAKELVSLVRVAELCEGGEDPYDLVVLDAPASGHALALLEAPSTFAAIVRSGPLAEQGERVRELLGSPRASAYVVVAHATEMAVSETLELERELRRRIERDVDAVVVNGAVSRRFTQAELARIAAAADAAGGGAGGTSRSSGRSSGRSGGRDDNRGTGDRSSLEAALAAAAGAAEAVNRRGRIQDGQIARLRHQRFEADGSAPLVVKVPLQITPSVDRQALEAIAARLSRGLGDAGVG